MKNQNGLNTVVSTKEVDIHDKNSRMGVGIEKPKTMYELLPHQVDRLKNKNISDIFS